VAFCKKAVYDVFGRQVKGEVRGLKVLLRRWRAGGGRRGRGNSQEESTDSNGVNTPRSSRKLNMPNGEEPISTRSQSEKRRRKIGITMLMRDTARLEGGGGPRHTTA